MEEAITVISTSELCQGSHGIEYKMCDKCTTLLIALTKSYFGQYNFHFVLPTSALQLPCLLRAQ